MYLYLREPARFDLLPEDLLLHFGTPELVMELELQSGRQLAREDVAQVLRNLHAQGFHLQLPPHITPHFYRGD